MLFWLVFIVVMIILFVLMYFSQKKQINKIEKNELEPILESLYKEPSSTSKHQQFLQGLRNLDEKISEYKGDGYAYSPNDRILELLLKHLDKYPTDALAHERFISIVAKSDQISEFGFKKLIDHIEKYPENLSSHERFASSLSKSRFLSGAVFESLLRYLDRFPTDPLVHRLFVQSLSKMIFAPTEYNQIAYNKTLEIIEKNPGNVNAKKLALEVGRWHFGKLRNGKPTIYDEQAIQNDISVRSSR